MTKEQLEERKTGLGGSDIAAILELSPWSTPIDVWKDKTGRSAPKPSTIAMELGNVLEDYVAQKFAEQTGMRVIRYRKMIHDGCLLANLDRLIVPDGEKIASYHGEIRTDKLLECKTSSVEWEGEREVVETIYNPETDTEVQIYDGKKVVPIYYQTQVQHYLNRAESFKCAYVAVLFLHFGKRVEFFRIDRDKEVGEYLDSFARKWWNDYVVADKMPIPVSEEEIKIVYNTANPLLKHTCDEELLKTVHEYSEMSLQKKEIEEALKEKKVAIQKAMTDAQELVGKDGTVLCTWKNDKDTVTTDTDWIELANRYSIPQSEIDSTTIQTTKKGARKFVVKSHEVISKYLENERKKAG